eukprot:301005-Chlamydomonas_euryale.AAC.3
MSDDPSVSELGTTMLKHGTDGAPFPFYLQATAPSGGACNDVRVWGMCRCDDGWLLPGCSVVDSSTWFALEGGGRARNDMLPAGLLVSCIEEHPGGGPSLLPPPRPPPPPQAPGGTPPTPVPTAPSADVPAPAPRRHGLSAGAIVGIVLACIVGVAAAAAAGWLCWQVTSLRRHGGGGSGSVRGDVLLLLQSIWPTTSYKPMRNGGGGRHDSPPPGSPAQASAGGLDRARAWLLRALGVGGAAAAPDAHAQTLG